MNTKKYLADHAYRATLLLVIIFGRCSIIPYQNTIFTKIVNDSATACLSDTKSQTVVRLTATSSLLESFLERWKSRDNLGERKHLLCKTFERARAANLLSGMGAGDEDSLRLARCLRCP